jgi:hypothetical protein
MSHLGDGEIFGSAADTCANANCLRVARVLLVSALTILYFGIARDFLHLFSQLLSLLMDKE